MWNTYNMLQKDKLTIFISTFYVQSLTFK